MYLFVRQDIPVPNQIVQVAHAVELAGKQFPQPEEASHMVLFGIADEERLMRAVERVREQGVEMAVFYEDDHPVGYTAACSAPVSSEEQRRVFKRYQLLR